MALRDETLAFIGCGMMGEAMIKGLLRDELVDPRQIVASHPRAERCLELESLYNVRVTSANREAAEAATFLVLAVKPQFLDEVVTDLDGSVTRESTVLSIVAGVPMERLGTGLGVNRVVRAMPNTPARSVAAYRCGPPPTPSARSVEPRSGPFCRPSAATSTSSTRASSTWPPR